MSDEISKLGKKIGAGLVEIEKSAGRFDALKSMGGAALRGAGYGLAGLAGLGALGALAGDKSKRPTGRARLTSKAQQMKAPPQRKTQQSSQRGASKPGPTMSVARSNQKMRQADAAMERGAPSTPASSGEKATSDKWRRLTRQDIERDNARRAAAEKRREARNKVWPSGTIKPDDYESKMEAALAPPPSAGSSVQAGSESPPPPEGSVGHRRALRESQQRAALDQRDARRAQIAKALRESDDPRLRGYVRGSPTPGATVVDLGGTRNQAPIPAGAAPLYAMRGGAVDPRYMTALSSEGAGKVTMSKEANGIQKLAKLLAHSDIDFNKGTMTLTKEALMGVVPGVGALYGGMTAPEGAGIRGALGGEAGGMLGSTAGGPMGGVAGLAGGLGAAGLAAILANALGKKPTDLIGDIPIADIINSMPLVGALGGGVAGSLGGGYLGAREGRDMFTQGHQALQAQQQMAQALQAQAANKTASHRHTKISKTAEHALQLLSISKSAGVSRAADLQKIQKMMSQGAPEHLIKKLKSAFDTRWKTPGKQGVKNVSLYQHAPAPGK